MSTALRPAAGPEAVRRRRELRDEPALALLLVLVVVVFAAVNSAFLSVDSLQGILLATAIAGLVGIGETLVLVSGQLDLSVGAVVSLSGAVSCQVVTSAGLPWPLAVPISVAVGVAVGAVNAVLVVRLGLPALIVTLATLYGAGGLALVVTGGLQISSLPEGLVAAGQARFLGTPMVVYLTVALVLLAHVGMRRTRYGASVYAIGGNERAALRAGVPVPRYVTSAFLVSGGLAGLAGILLAARLGVADPTQGQGLELTVITGAVVGGVSLFGGVGSMLAAFIGALLIQSVNSGLVLVGLDSTLIPAATGTLLIVAVAIDTLRRRSRRR